MWQKHVKFHSVISSHHQSGLLFLKLRKSSWTTEMECLCQYAGPAQGSFVPAARADLGVCTEACQKQAYLLGASQHKDPFRCSQRVKSSLYTSWMRKGPLLFELINWGQVSFWVAIKAPKQRIRGILKGVSLHFVQQSAEIVTFQLVLCFCGL